MSDDTKPFDSAAEHGRAIIEQLGPLAARMEQLAGEAQALATELGDELRRRGAPTQTTPPRQAMEYNLLGLWAQLTEQFASEFYRTAIQQGTAWANQPVGPKLAAVRGGKVQ